MPTVTVPGGGFHNVKPLEFEVDNSRLYTNKLNQECVWLTHEQYRKYTRHCCQKHGCTCGSYPPVLLRDGDDYLVVLAR